MKDIQMRDFKYWDKMVGWVVFAIATLSYLLTMEPTASLWDCGEFVATSYKLEVGHPPGAPLFGMLARLASMLAPSPEYVPMMINGMNCIASGFCILFLFWTITHLGRRILDRIGEPMSQNSMLLVLGAGVVGALSYAYTDTFWFSAVEGEVYALSSMFTALVVWLMLKWEENADSPTSMRWIILIAYLMGLSIGVHILNLLTIPALVMIYFFRRYEYRSTLDYVLKIFLALVVSMLILGAINGVIIPYTVALGAAFDTFAVNVLGLPVNAGMLIFVLLVFVALGWLIMFSHNRGKRVLNSFAIALTVILIGFSSYAMVTIRANANPPMNSNNPSNPHMLLSMLNRDQYGNRPLLRGPYYTAQPLPLVTHNLQGAETGDYYTATGDYESKTVRWYNPATKRYEKREVFVNYKYPDEAMRFFPRMWNRKNGVAFQDGSGNIIENPAEWRDDWYFPEYTSLEKRVSCGYDNDFFEYPQQKRIESSDAMTWYEPTAGDDFGYFLDYQMGDMFWRYFMWNFVGRQDDTQLECDPQNNIYLHGGWLSGIDFIDEMVSGPQSNLPDSMASNRARNTYFFLPLLLGLMGLIYQLTTDWRNFFVVLLLFVMMGIALVVYFNTAPNEPRERDYVYAGAFYAFSIWLGLGVLAVGDLVLNFLKSPKARQVATVLVLLFTMGVPTILATENWDDHDRSKRYMSRDIGWNFLNTTPQNAILINFGDNDTFPVWYCQEVEGVRPDVRVMNSSYLGGEWYVDEMKLAANSAKGVPFTIPAEKYSYVNEWVVTYDVFEAGYVNYETKLAALAAKYNDAKSMDMKSEYAFEYDVLYREYEAFVNAMQLDRTTYDLNLKDVIKLFISDSPMLAVVDKEANDMRLIELDAEVPAGYEVLCEVPAKMDSFMDGNMSDYLLGGVNYYIDVDEIAALEAGIITNRDLESCAERMYIKFNKSVATRDHLMMLDLIANFDWKRPISFTQPHIMQDYGIIDYARFDGYSYALVPIYTPYSSARSIGYMDIDALYPLYMGINVEGSVQKPLQFGNLADEDVYIDSFYRYNLSASRSCENFARVAKGFVERGDMEDLRKAERLLNRGLMVLPLHRIGYSLNAVLPYVEVYYMLGEAWMAYGDSANAERNFLNGDNLAVAFILAQAQEVRYYEQLVSYNNFSPVISSKLYNALYDIVDTLMLAVEHGGDFNSIVEQTSFDDLVKGYVSMLERATPGNIFELLEAGSGGHLSNQVALMSVIEREVPYNRVVDGKQSEASYVASLTKYLDRCLGALAASDAAQETELMPLGGVEVEYDSVVAEIEKSYAEGLASLDRASKSLEPAVKRLGEIVGVTTDVEHVDAFQYFYDLSEMASVLLPDAQTKGVNLSTVMSQLTSSDQEYVAAETYLDEGDKRAIQAVAQYAHAAEQDIRTMHSNGWSSEVSRRCAHDMANIIAILRLSQEMAGSFEWVANPQQGAAAEQVSFDELVGEYVAMLDSLTPTDAADEEMIQVLPHLLNIYDIYCFIPSGRGSGDASYSEAVIAFINREEVVETLMGYYKTE